ncbi:MAG: translation initiation factor IF-2 [Desulfovibrio sp.]|nr:translation initiation factor IF-2 [Desulfovibrio sp.]
MMPAVLSGLAAKARAHKLLTALVVVVLVAGLGAGGYFGWRTWQFRQTSEYATEQLKAALSPPNTEELAKRVDFRALFAELSHAVARAFPFYKAGPDQEHVLSQQLQTALLRRLREKDAGPAKGEEPDAAAKLRQPLVLFPPDFLAQLPAGLTLAETKGDSARIRTEITHPQLDVVFPLEFEMRRGPDGWTVRHLTNADEVAGLLRNALLARQKATVDVVLDKNEATLKRMESILPIQSCEAEAGLLSDGNTLLLMVLMRGQNQGGIQVNNMDLDTTIFGSHGDPVLTRHLNAAEPVYPGAAFSHRWSIELDAQSPEGQRVLGGIPLTCRPVWRSMGLSSAEVLHVAEATDLAQKCDMPGHDHPVGFCKLPIFQE